jgi:hypothetical protein
MHETAGVKAGTSNFVGSSALFSCSILENLINNYSCKKGIDLGN